MSERQRQILIVDPDPSAGRQVAAMLARAGYDVHCFFDAPAALSSIAESRPDLLITEQDLRGALSGLDLLRYAKRRVPDLPVVLVATHSDERRAVEAMRLGATTYLARPLDEGELLRTLALALDASNFQREMRRHCLEAAATELVGDSEAMQAVRETIADVAETPVTILLLGETGTGKELVARAIHRASPRAKERFVAVNCSAIPETLIEAELFGHVRGAYTGAERDRDGKLVSADRGTLLLDEIGDLPLQIQPKLLRFLEEGRVTPLGSDEPRAVDVRFIAATHHDLKLDVERGEFREDLYYRLNVVPIHLPPLRERRGDLRALLEHLLPRHAERHNRTIREIDPRVFAWIERRDWPGNVRELENALERLVVFCRDGILRLVDEPEQEAPLPNFQAEKQRIIDAFEAAYLRQALAACGGKLSEVSRRSGISSRQLYNLMHKHGIGRSRAEPMTDSSR